MSNDSESECKTHSLRIIWSISTRNRQWFDGTNYSGKNTWWEILIS